MEAVLKVPHPSWNLPYFVSLGCQLQMQWCMHLLLMQNSTKCVCYTGVYSMTFYIVTTQIIAKLFSYLLTWQFSTLDCEVKRQTRTCSLWFTMTDMMSQSKSCKCLWRKMRMEMRVLSKGPDRLPNPWTWGLNNAWDLLSLCPGGPTCRWL